MAALRRRVTGHDGQRGALSLFVAITVTGMVLAIALLVDASGRLNAGVEVDEYANEAARAGIQQINAADAVNGKSIQINCKAAQGAARNYLATLKISSMTLTGKPVISCLGPRTLEVSVTASYSTKMLSIIGIDTLAIGGHGEATLVTGQQTPDLEQQP
ncbi:hypothetical protein [Streptacidiphilus sp. P02-A3a]|uniref:hypothetical protein n=1 Tax=Streptacidiphilus sp. P02-A3a TaxID=2704468 RepID=UPI0015F85CEB|nr:hypothetical protein [Streptacidiphilus sp. P02-A3a]QMU68877.1 hypothetical protein GXP74_12185 [Streptacidiphilus sp. P02-A3a]